LPAIPETEYLKGLLQVDPYIDYLRAKYGELYRYSGNGAVADSPYR
jgi:hypothetical protein